MLNKQNFKKIVRIQNDLILFKISKESINSQKLDFKLKIPFHYFFDGNDILMIFSDNFYVIYIYKIQDSGKINLINKSMVLKFMRFRCTNDDHLISNLIELNNTLIGQFTLNAHNKSCLVCFDINNWQTRIDWEYSMDRDTNKYIAFVKFSTTEFYRVKYLEFGHFQLDFFRFEKNNYELRSTILLETFVSFYEIKNIKVTPNYLIVSGHLTLDDGNDFENGYVILICYKGILTSPFSIVYEENADYLIKDNFCWKSFEIFEKYILVNCSKRGIGVIYLEKAETEIINFKTSGVKYKNTETKPTYSEEDIAMNKYKRHDFVYINPWKKEILEIIPINKLRFILILKQENSYTKLEMTIDELEQLLNNSNVEKLPLGYSVNEEFEFEQEQMKRYEDMINHDWKSDAYEFLTGETPPDDEGFDFDDVRDSTGL